MRYPGFQLCSFECNLCRYVEVKLSGGTTPTSALKSVSSPSPKVSGAQPSHEHGPSKSSSSRASLPLSFDSSRGGGGGTISSTSGGAVQVGIQL
jgi:hypothetical protein